MLSHRRMRRLKFMWSIVGRNNSDFEKLHIISDNTGVNAYKSILIALPAIYAYECFVLQNAKLIY